ncbi:MAG: CsgG/HfaB family protein [Geobacteraceae bacterium]|nr:CsgG/HfaB family protein [Geobacteraceae bacterium]
MPVRMILILAAAILMVSLIVPPVLHADESSGSWRGKWWNYYDRAISRSEDGNFESARSDLVKAIGLRDKDQRRARTYGMHFIDYFPHRELGIVCFNLGDLEQAQSELELSLASVETAKASFYLNAVRSRLIRQQGLKPPPPAITVDFPAPNQFIKDSSITVTGRVTGDGLVSSIRINGRPYRFELAELSRPFSMEVPLDDDDTEVVVESADLAGGVARTEIPVSIDREGPSLSLTSVTRLSGGNGRVRITAKLYDFSGIGSLRVNGVEMATANSTEIELDTSVVVPTVGATVSIDAVDVLGNRTTVELQPDRDRAELLKNPEPVLLAMNGPGIFSADREAPLISLKESEDLPAVYIDRYYVEGDVFDSGQVERITVNGKEIRTARGKKVYFSKMLKLKEGNNRVTVEAFDGSGNRSVTNFNIRRIVPASRQNLARMSLSVLPFSGRIKNSTVQEMADDFLVAALLDQKRFQVVEREKLKQILQEQKLSKEKLTDPEHSVRIGKLLSADALLITTIAEGQKALEIISRLVSSETAEVMETKDAYVEDKSLAAVKEMMEGLASKLTLGFPVVEGIVVKREKGILFADLGASSGIRKSMPASIYRRGKEVKHPLTGKSLGWDMVKLGEGTIEDVQDDFCKIRLGDRVKQQDIQVKDTIITR